MVLQLDNVPGTENFNPDWGRHLPVIRRYTPAIERWRTEVEAQMPESLRRRSDAAQLLDKYLWTMSGENPAGDPTIFHDGGNGYGLMADRVSRTPPGSPPDVQLRNAWNLVANNPKTWTDWGEGSSYQGKPFGALGVIAPYDPDPSATHPTQGGTSRIRPPSTGDSDEAGAMVMPSGWIPPTGFASSEDVPITEKLRIAREKRLRDTGYIPPGSAGEFVGGILSTGQVRQETYDKIQADASAEGNARQGVHDLLGGGLGGHIRSLGEAGLSAASDVFSSIGDVSLLPTSAPTPGGGQAHGVTAGDVSRAAVTPIEPLKAVQDVAGEAGRVAGPYVAPGYEGIGRPLLDRALDTHLPTAGDIGEEAAKGLVPTTPLDLALTAPQVGEAAGVARRVGVRLYDEAAVRAAANETFDRLAPASLLRHERAGAAIAQEAAGLHVDPRSPFARSANVMDFGAPRPLNYTTEPLPRSAGEARQGGAAAGRTMGPEVAGGGAGRAAYGDQIRREYVALQGEEAAARYEKKFTEQGLEWADIGDLTSNLKTSTPAYAVDPGSASVSTGFKGDPNNPSDVTSAIRSAVGDVRAERAGQGTREQLSAAQQRLRGAQAGREAGPEVGGGRAGITPGRPADAQSDEAWAARVAEAKVKAQSAAPHRFWYENSSKGILAMAHGDVADADLITRIAAVGSNQITVPQQGRTILQGWQQWKAGEKVTAAANMRTVSDRVDKALRMSNDEWDNYVVSMIKKGDNQKVTNFWLDMMDDIDPARALKVREAAGATDSATVDMWMLRAFGYANDQSPTAAQYRTIVGGMQSIANDLGWTPKQVQAAIWVQQIVDSGKPLREAATDYGAAVSQHAAHLRNEVIPTPSNPRYENVGMALHNAPPEAVAEYAKTIDSAFRDENGADILARMLNLPVDPVHGNPLVSGTISKGPARGLANEAQAAVVDTYASARAAALGQDEVQWYRPFNLKAEGFHNAVRFDVGREVMYDDIVALKNELADLDLMYIPNGTQLSVVRPVSEADWAARAANSDAVPAAVTEANKAFRKRVGEAAEGYFGSVSAREEAGTMETFATDGRRFALDANSLQAGALGRPDVRAAVDTISERVAAADDVFAAAHTPGITPNGAQPSAASSRLTGARRGREAGAEVAGGSVGPPGERPKTTWTITPKEGDAYRVETNAGPRSSSVEEAQATFASETERARQLGVQARGDQALGRAQQAAEGVARIRAGETDPAFDYSKMREVATPSREKATWVDPQGRVFEVLDNGEHTDALKGLVKPTELTMESGAPERAALDAAYDRGWVRMVTHDADRYGNRRAIEISAATAQDAAKAVENVAEKMQPGVRAQTDVLIDLTGSDRTIHSTLDTYLASGGDIRRAGARQGRVFGGEVGGGSAGVPGAPPAPVTPPAAPTNPVYEAVKGLGRELASTPGAALSTVASYSPQIGRQGLPAFFMNPRRTLRNLATSLKAGVSEAEGTRILDATLTDDWIRSTSQADAAAKAAYDAAYAKAGPVWRANNKPPASGSGPNAGYTWQDVGGTVLDWRGQGPLEGKTLKELKAIADEHGIGLSKNVTAARAREQIARDLRPELLEGLSQETKVGRAAEGFTRPSSRQSAIELNLYRTDWYKGVAQAMKDAGETDVGEYEKLRKTIEIFTQRGAWKQPFSFPAFFSTRAMSARVQMIERGMDAMLHFPDMFKPGARQEAGKALLAMTAGNLTMMAGLYGAASAAGLQPKIEMDGKLPTLTVGDAFHFDPWAGINTPARLVFGVIADTLANPEGGIENAPQAAISSIATRGQKLLRGGLSPIFGKVADTATGRDFTGQKYSLKDDILSGGMARDLLAPMLATSTAEGFAQGGVPGAVATGVPSSLSVSVNAYMRPEDAANRSSRDKYGSEYNDLSRDDRLAIIGSLPDEHRKPLEKVERKVYESDIKKAGWQEYWPADDKAQFFRDHPDLEARAWYFDRRTLQNTDSVDQVLEYNVPNREVRFQGLPVNIARDDQTKQAWADSRDVVQWYTYDLPEQSQEAAARRMYRRSFDDLSDEQQASVVANVRQVALKKDADAAAWMYWWGKVKKTPTNHATSLAEVLLNQYGPGAGAKNSAQLLGEAFDARNDLPPARRRTTTSRRRVRQPAPAPGIPS